MPPRMAYSPATRLFRRLAAEEEQETSHRRSPVVARRMVTRRVFLRGAGAMPILESDASHGLLAQRAPEAMLCPSIEGVRADGRL